MDKNQKVNNILMLAAVIAWVSVGALGFYTVLMLQEMIFRIYSACCADNRWGFTGTRQWSSIILMLIWVSFTVWLGDYQLKHFAEIKAWKLIGMTFLVLLIVIVAAGLI